MARCPHCNGQEAVIRQATAANWDGSYTAQVECADCGKPFVIRVDPK